MQFLHLALIMKNPLTASYAFYFCQFSLKKTGVQVFQQSSRGENMILEIVVDEDSDNIVSMFWCILIQSSNMFYFILICKITFIFPCVFFSLERGICGFSSSWEICIC